MRLEACRALGWKEVPVVRASNLTPEKVRRFIITDNLPYGEWDWDVLANEWDADQLVDWGMDIPNFTKEGDGHGAATFDDPGGNYQSQYGVIVICESEQEQKSVFDTLVELGYKCKVVVT